MENKINKFIVKHLLIILIVCVICLIIFFVNKRSNVPIKFPYRKFKDENGNILPIVGLTAFFRDNEAKQIYYELRNENQMIVGVTAYKSFPKPITDPSEDKYHLSDDFNYTKEVDDWLCCFKDTELMNLLQNNNLIDISESDFYNSDSHNTLKRYDFIYICNKDDDSCPLNGWNAINRNFDLAKKCFPMMFKKYNLRGLIVGRIGCGLENDYPDNVEITDFLPYHELQQKMKECKFLFVPNIYDASPRVVTECLVKNIPVLMNQNIVCGSKYINQETGELFSNEIDLEPALNNLLGRITSIQPSLWFMQHYGRQNTGKKLRDFLYNSSKNNSKYQYIEKILEKVKEVSFVI